MTKAQRRVGYVVLWQGRPTQEVALSSLRREEAGRLYYASTAATIWRTRSQARAAMRRAIRAWARPDEARQWEVISLRPAGRAALQERA